MLTKKKVLFFLPSNTGGAERMTVTIAKMLPLDKFEVKFVIIHKSLGTIINFIPSVYEIIHIPVHNIYCAGTLRMIDVIRKEKPDAVFSSLLYLNARLIIASKICGCRVVVRNNIDISRTISRIAPILVKYTYKWADVVIAQQEEMRNEIIAFTGIQEKKVVTLHNPIDIDNIHKKIGVPNPYEKKDNKCINYVCVGRFSKEKGQDLAVKAFRIVLKNEPNAHLYLVGKYDWNKQYDRSVRDYISMTGLSEQVHFVGFDTNPYRWIYHSDCYIMPSRLEGLPNSLIDAMYLQKPVVATKCIPVVERIVKDGYNGYLAENNNIDSIASGMIRALSLKGFYMTYQPSKKEDFIKLF